MSELKGYQEEIIEFFEKEHLDFRNLRTSEFRQIFGGADTTIYGFDLFTETQTLQLILRIYRPSFSDSGLKEFRVIQNLHDRGVGVPKPYFFKEESSSTGRTYVVMERIDGSLLSDELYYSLSTPRFEQLLDSAVRNLVAIHSIDWTKGLTFLNTYDIVNNPHLFLTYELATPKRLINEYGVDDLLPVIEWMEVNQEQLETPCLLHGDYHGMNNLVKESHQIVTIDWGNAKLGDCRYDLGFAILSLNSMGIDMKEKVVSLYEEISGKTIHHVEYFMVLSALFNLLRVYSSVFNHRITNETDDTARLFLNDYRDYALRVVLTTQEITGVSLDFLLDVLEQ